MQALEYVRKSAQPSSKSVGLEVEKWLSSPNSVTSQI